MSYDKSMFHLIADELHRIAYETNCEKQLDSDDLFTAVDALAYILVNRREDVLAEIAICVTAASLGDMYEVFEELPDAKEQLVEILMDEQGFQLVGDEQYTLWIRRDD